VFLRRIAAILLIGALLFNWIGYRLLTGILEDDAARRLEARLDRQQYDESQLISIKVPVTHLAYYNTSTEFQRTDGSIEIDGIPYKYVKCRLANDSLEMLCIPNTTTLKLRHTDPGNPPYVAKAFSQDPYVCIQLLQIGEPQYTLVKNGFYFCTNFTTVDLPTEEHPPACQIS
jgi:hypothetical protein